MIRNIRVAVFADTAAFAGIAVIVGTAVDFFSLLTRSIKRSVCTKPHFTGTNLISKHLSSLTFYV